jgi:hypothetical protein
MNYFGISSYYRPIPEIDHWLRRRIRTCCWKQWRRCRTKVRNLLKLGTPLNAAISVGMSRKNSWRLARTFATQLSMINQWLKKQELISVKELWVNIHYPATARQEGDESGIHVSLICEKACCALGRSPFCNALPKVRNALFCVPGLL